MFPWIPFLKSRRRRLSDTEFMAIKAFDGKVVTVTGTINAVTNTIEYVPASGKTFYFHEATIVMVTNPSATSTAGGVGTASTSIDQIVADLKIDSTVYDTAKIGMATSANSSQAGNSGSGSGFGLDGKCKFNCKGLTLVGNSAKKIEIENVLDSGSARATLIGWIEDTGTSPQV